MLCLISSMCTSNSLYVLLKISVKTFWYYSEQYKTLSNLISYHTKKSQLLLTFVTSSNIFSVMHNFYIILYSHNSWISTFLYNWNRTMLVFKEKVKSDYFPKYLHHCLHILACLFIKKCTVQEPLQLESCIIFKRCSLWITWVCMYV